LQETLQQALNHIYEVRCLNKAGQLLCTLKVRGGLLLWVPLRKSGLPMGAACSGVGVCGACHVRVEPASHVTPLEEFEKKTLQKQGLFADGVRISCLCRVLGNIDVTADYW
jgi:ferredoxin